MRFRQAFTTVAIAALLPIPALADELSESRVKELVLEAIRENPEIVMEAVAILEQRQAQAQELSFCTHEQSAGSAFHAICSRHPAFDGTDEHST